MCQKKIMRKRSSENIEEPPKKRISPGGNVLPDRIAAGEILTDITGKQWKLGKPIGLGGFGEIYLASDNIKECVKHDAPYVVKIENHSNGPLFVEINCLLRIGRLNMINDWKDEHKMASLGMPHYIASGSHVNNNEKVRFLVLSRYEQDLEKIFLNKQKKFNLKTVINICTQIMDILEYVHTKGYIHCDLKASNILYSLQKVTSVKRKKVLKTNKSNPVRACRFKRYRTHNLNLRNMQNVSYRELDDLDNYVSESDASADETESKSASNRTINQVYLIDYGLATKYRHSNGQHKEYCIDQRKAHAGTILFCSLDAHLGVTSRRSDLETLGYNMIYWLTSDLPWSQFISNPETVQQKKEECLANLNMFLQSCFPDCPTFIYEYFKYVKSLSFDDAPDYSFCKKLLQDALSEYGYKQDGCFDFDNEEGWRSKAVQVKHIPVEVKRATRQRRIPFSSNIIVNKALRRRKNNKVDNKKVNWSRILRDPEVILRQSNKQPKPLEMVNKTRERRITETSDTVIGNTLQNLDIWALNPTYAMIEVFNKSKDKNANYNSLQNKNGKNDGSYFGNHNGYTPAMKMVLSKMYVNRLNETQKQKVQNVVTVHFTLRNTRSNKLNTKKSNSDFKRTKSSNFAKEIRRKPRSPRFLRGYGLRG